MKKIILILSLILSYSLLAITKSELRPGDVILLPLNCTLCQAIEQAEETQYSHSGVVVWDQYNRPFVLEALGTVRSVSLETFLKRAPLDRKPVAYRPQQFTKVTEWTLLSETMFEVFEEKFAGAGFDHDFLWDNVDQNGQEIYYCSEFVAKLLNNFLKIKITPYPMDFSNNYEYWLKYFKGNVPQGKPGNSPASFTRDPNFVNLGAIN